MYHSHLVRFRVVPWSHTTDAELSDATDIRKQLAEKFGMTQDEIEILEVVSPEERLNRLVSDNLPPSIAGWLSCYAYEQGHAYGEDEVNGILFDMSHGLIDALKKPGTLEWFASRLK
jgi:hypothetical protein